MDEPRHSGRAGVPRVREVMVEVEGVGGVGRLLRGIADGWRVVMGVDEGWRWVKAAEELVEQCVEAGGDVEKATEVV